MRPVGRDRPDLELELLGAPRHLGDLDRHTGEAMGDLRSVSRNAMKAQQKNQRLQTLIASDDL